MTPALLTFALVLARIGGLIATLPLFSMSGIPRWAGPLIALATSASICARLSPISPPPGEGLLPLGLGVASEVVLGATLGLGVASTFAALALGAEIMSSQMGLSFATLFDPFTKASESLLGTLSSWMSALAFVGLGLHHRCLLLVSRSFERVPLGAGIHPAGAGELIGAVGGCLSLGVQLAGPIVAMVWLVHVFVALLSKLAPKMNAFFAVGTTATGVVGLGMLAVSLPWLLAIQGEAMSAAVDGLGRQLSGR